jgi:site-specific DNA recombinase
MSTATATGREYLRVSQDRSGRARSVEEQHQESQAAAAERGVTLGEPYGEPEAISASRYSKKARGGFGQLVSDLTAGRFGASELWLWESSRGSRKVGEWLTLLELCEAQEVRIHVTSHGRTYDPTNWRDRRSLLEDAVDSEADSGKSSARIRRSAAAALQAGRPSGHPPYGYRRRYDERTHKMIAQVPEPGEAAVIREVFERIKSGHSLRSIAADFEVRGLRTRSGKIFSPQHLRTLALCPVYVGWRVSDPDKRKLGRKNPRPPGTPGVTVIKGTWEPIISEATYRSVVRLLTDARRKTTRPGKAKHLLSGIAFCAKCGSPITVTLRREVPAYQCQRGCIRIQKTDLEELAEAVILGYLARPDIHDRLSRADSDNTQLSAVRDELAATRTRMTELADAAAAGSVSIATVVRAEPQILATIAQLERREGELSTPAQLRGFITPGEHVARRWESTPMAARREIARLLLSPEYLGRMVVLPGQRGRHVPAEERVVWRSS